MLVLYTYFRSSAAYRVRCALNHKGLAWTPEVVWLPSDDQRSDAYLDVNRQGLVPTLVDGSTRLNQSLAIIEYLDETKPGAKLLPDDAAGRARVRSLSLLVACDIHPVNNLRILKYLKNVMQQEQAAIDTWYRHWVDEGLAAYERELAAGPAGRYSHGDTVSMADCCLVPQVFNAKRFQVDLSRYPRLMAVHDELARLPAFDAAQPARQPDAARAS